MNVPSNHRQAERRLITLVHSGEWEIDEDGFIWRIATRSGDRWRPGTIRLNPCKRRRVEKVLESGYLMVRASIDGVRVVGLAHRLVWQHFRGDIPDGLIVNHKDGCKANNRLDNLEPETYSGNAKHAYRIGLIDEHGERNPAAKLSDDEVAQLRGLYAAGGITMDGVAARFRVSVQHVSSLVRGKRRPLQGGPIARDDLRVREFSEARP